MNRSILMHVIRDESESKRDLETLHSLSCDILVGTNGCRTGDVGAMVGWWISEDQQDTMIHTYLR